MMLMNVGKELIAGTVGSLLIVGLSGYYARSYQERMNRVPAAIPTLQTTPSDSTTPDATMILTKEEIAKHNIPSDCWIIINGSVYTVSAYLTAHPGGAGIIIPYCGTDATAAYDTKGGKGSHSSGAAGDLASLKLGALNQTVNASVAITTPIQGTPRGIQRKREDDD